jgi:pimeloyl-ACP methyl ester carboxylesterase
MSTNITKDGAQIHYKDWSSGQPVVFSHRWSLSVDVWDSQMLDLASPGFEHAALKVAAGAPWPNRNASPTSLTPIAGFP